MYEGNTSYSNKSLCNISALTQQKLISCSQAEDQALGIGVGLLHAGTQGPTLQVHLSWSRALQHYSGLQHSPSK